MFVSEIDLFSSCVYCTFQPVLSVIYICFHSVYICCVFLSVLFNDIALFSFCVYYVCQSVLFSEKLKTCLNNPASRCVFEPTNSKLFEKSKLTPLVGLPVLPLFEDSKIDLDVVDDVTVSDTPLWSQSEPQICLFLTK